MSTSQHSLFLDVFIITIALCVIVRVLVVSELRVPLSFVLYGSLLC